MLQSEYYVVERENNNNYPLFSWDQSSGDYGLGKPIQNDSPLKFRLGDPVSPKFEWVDFHKAPQPVISPLLVSVLAPLDIYGIQIIPAEVRNPKDPFAEPHDYCFVHVWNRISCLDKVNSEVEYMKSGRIFSIDKFVLDDAALNQYELRKRLMFELAENTSVLLVHQSIKDAIEAAKPKGIRFFSVNDWNSDSSFD